MTDAAASVEAAEEGEAPPGGRGAPEKKSAGKGEPGLSPAMRQYQQFKAQYPGYVLFFRMGDFYEMFWEDAQVAARTLGVALTSRSRGGLGAEDAIPMAGVPFHAVDNYLRRMIAAGRRYGDAIRFHFTFSPRRRYGDAIRFHFTFSPINGLRPRIVPSKTTAIAPVRYAPR